MSYFKGIYGTYDGTNFVPARLDASTHTLQVIDYEHHEIHSGSHFFFADAQDLSINNVFDLQWTTPDTTEWAHFTFKLNCESETSWWIYEGATISTAGATITPINNNRNSLHASSMTIAGILNTSIANANSDTPVAEATEIAHGFVGSGKTAGIEIRSTEIILKRDTIYCFRAEAVTAGYVSFLIEWYEHTDKN